MRKIFNYVSQLTSENLSPNKLSFLEVWLCAAAYVMSRLMTKPTKWHVRPVKTQISLGIHPV